MKDDNDSKNDPISNLKNTVENNFFLRSAEKTGESIGGSLFSHKPPQVIFVFRW